MFFVDSDGDLHGDPLRAMPACEQPAGMVTSSDDCDDNNAQRYPGLAEMCDGLDNDCTLATTEVCPAGCVPVRRPAPDDKRVYLMCGNTASWTNARTTCAGAQYKLVQIDDALENVFIRNTVSGLYGSVDIHIGGSDSATENTWVWDGSDTFFMNGAPVMNRFTNWTPGEPNDDGTEDCAEMKPSGQWNDSSCGDGQRFVCRR